MSNFSSKEKIDHSGEEEVYFTILSLLGRQVILSGLTLFDSFFFFFFPPREQKIPKLIKHLNKMSFLEMVQSFLSPTDTDKYMKKG